ncbi:MAG: hypothetical protein QJR09_12630 [Micrococcus sp.]|nr:hypothetical protein [Micrococcus sp.]
MSRSTRPEELAAIRPVKEAIEDELLARPGVVGVDIGDKVSGGENTGEPSILVFVRQKKPREALPPEDVIPPEVNGVKTDVQELVIELQSARQLLVPGRQVDTAAYPRLAGGISMGPARSVRLEPSAVEAAGEYVFVGTLGAMVGDRATGATMALTNFHVACVNDGWTVGDRMVQPARPDGGDAATQQFGSLARAVLSEHTDGAVVTVDAGRHWDSTVIGIGDVAGSAAARLGMAVQKRGRTTGRTFGTVASTEATLNLDYGDGLGTRTLRRQVRITTDTARSPRFSEGGDSGSAVLDMDRNVVGLLFAGSMDGSTTFANPIAVALEELGAELLSQRDTAPPPSPAPASTSPAPAEVPAPAITISVVVNTGGPAPGSA